jgi:HSP20 family protein
MKTTLWKGFAPSSTYRRSTEDFFNDQYRYLLGMQNDFVPPMNMREDKNHYTLEVVAPGLKKDDFDITVIDGRLTVNCEKDGEAEYNVNGYTHREFSTTSFSRSLQLPKDIDDDHISANYENGILKIRLPRQAMPEENEAIRRIAIA